ncbi:hypothetical protein CDAR_476691 [Caerostris darwini]|uniref:Uncharacterized protein n=1 Tax=Caerostris darwini TaxID=1538125 RepID=A0AAV4TXR6_9ARAC|nr:hypothetical protein CDAR_476691 [Caerostris darwini]
MLLNSQILIRSEFGGSFYCLKKFRVSSLEEGPVYQMNLNHAEKGFNEIYSRPISCKMGYEEGNINYGKFMTYLSLYGSLRYK